MACQVLLADDDADLISSYITAKSDDSFELGLARTQSDCMRLIKLRAFDVVLLDISFEGNSDLSGLDLIAPIKKLQPDAEIILLSYTSNVQLVKEGLKLGARTFWCKSDHDLNVLPEKITHALGRRRQRYELADRGRRLADEVGAVFRSEAMASVYTLVAQALKSKTLNVLVTGETGVGKELVAQALAKGLGRSIHPVNCAALQDTLVESEFFGHERGSFTGATASRAGAFARANGGILFLDEVACLTPKAQSVLLRVLQNRDYSPVGSNATRQANAKVVSATNADLKAMVGRGSFREDLYQRLAGIRIDIPALRDRPDDILPTIELLVGSLKPGTTFDPMAAKVLTSYHWPRNVRQLRHAIESILTSIHSRHVEVGDLPREILSSDTVSNKDSGPRFRFATDFGRPLSEVIDEAMSSYIEQTRDMLEEPHSFRKLAKILHHPRMTLERFMKRTGMSLKVSKANGSPQHDIS